MKNFKSLISHPGIIPYSLVVFLSIITALLIVQNLRMKKILDDMNHPTFDQLKPGDKAAAFRFITMNGDTNLYNSAELPKKQLIFVLSSTCPHCKNNLKHWEHLAQDANQIRDLNVMGMCVSGYEETRRYINDNHIGFYLASTADTTFITKYKIEGVPQTIMLNSSGVIENVWIGELTDSLENIIRKS
jgi:peroxiredoxin